MVQQPSVARLPRPPFWPALVLLAVAGGVWLLLWPSLLSTTLAFDLLPEQAGPRWQAESLHDSGATWEHTLNLALAPLRPESLEVELPAGAALRAVTPVDPRFAAVDLKRVLREGPAGDRRGEWQPEPVGVDGIRALAADCGLRVWAPPLGVRVTIDAADSRTGGGAALLRYGDTEQRVPLPASGPLLLTRTQLPPHETFPVRIPLPGGLSGLRLRPLDTGLARFALASPRVEQRLGGVLLRSRLVAPSAGDGADAQDVADETWRFTASGEEGAIVFSWGPVEPGVHAAGVLALWALLLSGLGLCYLLPRDIAAHRRFACASRLALPRVLLGRHPWLLLTLLLACAVLWPRARGLIVERELHGTITPAGVRGALQVEWRRAETLATNGSWISEPSDALLEETLEIVPSGAATQAGARYELWLYKIKPLNRRHAPLDLPTRLRGAQPDEVRGRWVVSGPDVPGLRYEGNEPGLLRLRVPAGGVRVEMARTSGGGPVTLRYADQERTVDAGSGEGGLHVELQRRSLADGVPIELRQPLPNYEMDTLRLRWTDAAGARLDLTDLRIQTRVFGIRTREVYLRAVTRAAEVSDEAGTRTLRPWNADDAATLRGRVALSASVQWAGIAGLWAMLLGGFLAAGALVRVAPRLHRSRAVLVELLALSLVVGVPFWLATWAPMIFTGDSLDYLLGAIRFVQTLSSEHFNSWRLPGYSFFLAPFYALFARFDLAVGWAQALLGVAIALMCRQMLVPHLPRPWPALAALLVALDAEVLVYQRILLSEVLTTFWVTLLAFLLHCYGQLILRRPGAASREMVLAALIGVLCGVGAYVRGNLQLLIVLLPVIVACLGLTRPPRGRGILGGLVIAGLGVLLILPWIARNAKRHEVAEFVVGKQVARNVSQYSNGTIILNQSGRFPAEIWRQMRGDLLSGRLGVDEYVALVEQTDRPLPRAGDLSAAPPGPRTEAQGKESRHQFMVEESLALNPRGAIRGILGAALIQTGLWPHVKTPGAEENIWWSTGLRGDFGASKPGTNYILNLDGFRGESWSLLEPIVERTRVPLEPLRDDPNAKLLNQLFWSFRCIRPLLAVLLCVGLAYALAERRWMLVAIGLIVLAGTLSLAVLVSTSIDRYGVPFKPLLSVMAVFGAWRLLAGAAPGPSDAALPAETPGEGRPA